MSLLAKRKTASDSTVNVFATSETYIHYSINFCMYTTFWTGKQKVLLQHKFEIVSNAATGDSCTRVRPLFAWNLPEKTCENVFGVWQMYRQESAIVVRECKSALLANGKMIYCCLSYLCNGVYCDIYVHDDVTYGGEMCVHTVWDKLKQRLVFDLRIFLVILAILVNILHEESDKG
jgi:hypothetical protein